MKRAPKPPSDTETMPAVIEIQTQNPRPQSQLPEPLANVLDDIPDTLAQDHTKDPVLFGPSPLAVAFRFIKPWRNYIMYVDMEARTGNHDAEKYLACWKALAPSERRSHLPEQICSMASVAASDLASWVTRQVWLEGSTKASMCLSFMRDSVLERTAEFAMDSPENFKHAELFMKAAGMLPNGKGGNPINIYNHPVASSGAVAGVRSEGAASTPAGLRGMDEEITDLARIMQGGDDRLLEAVSEEDDDDEDEDDEDETDDE